MPQNFILASLTIVSLEISSYSTAINELKKLLEKHKVKNLSTKSLSDLVLDFFFKCTFDQFEIIRKEIRNMNIYKTDIFLQEAQRRRKKIIACDMDMTVINVETIDLVGKEILKNDKISQLTKSTMNGEVGFKESIIYRTKMLKNVRIEKIVKLINNVKINPGVTRVIKTMNSFGYHTMLISGGYDIVAEIIGKKIGFKEIISNSLEIKNNIITGNIKSSIIDRKGKLEHLKEKVKNLKLNRHDTIAIGDGDNDIDMISYASVGVAWNGYPKVQSVADLKINSNFETILYIQGYKDSEIIKE